LLQSNEVLIVGGTTDNGNGDISASTAEIYDPASNSWSQTGNPLAAGSMGQTTTLLQNGKVLHVTAAVAPASAEIYDPVGKTWSAAAPLAAPRYLHTATLLPNGSVLIVGGFLLAGISNAADITASTEIYDPVSNTWTAASALSNAREAHAATLLQNGVVLVEGGIGSSGGAITSSELYWFH
jgi:N-acetylneuraminic acid mutarotase